MSWSGLWIAGLVRYTEGKYLELRNDLGRGNLELDRARCECTSRPGLAEERRGQLLSL